MIEHEDFARLDGGSFKAFVAAAKALNFTTAAEKAAMTQSGVSQHVARLERELGRLQEREAVLHAELAEHATDHARVLALDGELRELHAERAATEEAWLAAAALLES